MEEISTIGIDIAKSVFQVHGIGEAGEVIVRRQLKRRQVLPFFAELRPCLIGMEACATAHHWARELMKFGHDVRLMPPRYVKPYVKRNKNDAADAEAICEAVTRPAMRFVPVKTVDQQSIPPRRLSAAGLPSRNSTPWLGSSTNGPNSNCGRRDIGTNITVPTVYGECPYRGACVGGPSAIRLV